MKVLHLATTYPLHNDDSNAAFVEALCEGLCARGHEVHVLLPAHPRLVLRRDGRHSVLHAFPTTPLKRWHPWGYAQALSADRSLRWDAYIAAPFAAVAAWRRARRIIRDHDIDILHANWLVPGGPIFAAAARSTRTPLVISCHGSGVFLAEKRRWAAVAARWGLRRAAAVTACSRDLTDRVAAFGAGPEPQWIPYGVDVECFRPPSSEGRAALRAALGERHELPPAEPWILAVGRLVHKKGFENLVAAMPAVASRHPTAHLVIAGDGPLREPLRRRAAASGVAERVHLVGAVAHGEVGDWYGAADLIAVPSVHGPAGNVDGLPNVFLEALASGTAVVASDVGGIPDVGRDGETVALVAEGDVQGLAAAIAELLADSERRRAIGAAARADAEERLDWGRVAERFERLYEGLVAG